MKPLCIRIVVCFLAIGNFFLFPAPKSLTLIKTIGSEKENYTFSRLSSAVLSPRKDVFIADGKEHFIAKYSWDGKFVKKIGQRGQGPMDFNGPKCLTISDDKLFLLDTLNMRVVSMDLDLTSLAYYKFNETGVMLGTMSLIYHNRLIGGSPLPTDDGGKIKAIDLETQAHYSFFKEKPAAIKKNTKNARAQAALSFLISPVYSLNENKQKLLVSFQYPGNPIEFFIYSIKGKELNSFKFSLPSDFSFPHHSVTSSYPIKYPAESHTAIVDSIHTYKGHYWVFLVKLHRKRKKVIDTENSCLIFDEKGNLAGEFKMKMGLKVLSISQEGYMLAKNYEANFEQLFIYRITYKID